MLVALAWFARLPVDATYLIDVLPSLALIGIGAGLAFPSLVGLAMSGATRERRGSRLGPREHDPPGRRRAGPRGDGVARDGARRRSSRPVPTRRPR